VERATETLQSAIRAATDVHEIPVQGMTNKKLGRDGKDGTFTYRTLLVAGMHFQDAYNYDIERVKRC
jgi:uncharacterized radical SAM superfamily Fe-S cluster-containing enzyme